MVQVNRIKEETFRAYDVVKKGKHDHRILHYTDRIQYDRAGRKIKHIDRHEYFNQRQKKPVSSEYFYKYKEQMMIEECYCQPPGNLLRKEVYIHDHLERVTNIYTFNAEELIYEIQYVYDNKGREIQMINICYLLGENTYRYYTYNTKGQMTKERVCDKDDNLVQENIYVYNKQGKKIRETTFDKWGAKRDMILYLYDNKNDLVQKKYYQRTLKEMAEYTYTTMGKIKQAVCKHYRFDCDCTGVRQIPGNIEITEYRYY